MIRFVSPYFLVLVFMCFACELEEEKNQDPPNVVFILIDDLGWTDLGIYGSDYYQTPNVDALAADGIRYTNGYAACTVCSPTRASIMTGKYPATINCTDWIEGHKMPDKPLQVPDWTMYMDTLEYTMAEAFRDNGYTTAHIGKWHLGEDSIYWPENQGFNLNVGGFSKGSPVWREGEAGGYFAPFGNPRIKDKPDDTYLTDRLTDEAVNFIRQAHPDKTGKPFYLNFWTYNVHTPLMAMEEKVIKYEQLRDTTRRHHNPTYAAMVEHMDDAVGRIIATLKEEGLYENTIIVFTSDNGGLVGRNRRVTSNYPLRNGKGHVYEGGVRVPVILKGPGLAADSVSYQPVISMDFYPTLAEQASLEVPDHVKSSWEGLHMFQSETSRDLFWHYPHYHTEGATPYSAIRSGNWRLVLFYESNTSELYDLASDPGESRDLSEQYPDLKKHLLKKLNRWKDEVAAQEPAATR